MIFHLILYSPKSRDVGGGHAHPVHPLQTTSADNPGRHSGPKPMDVVALSGAVGQTTSSHSLEVCVTDVETARNADRLRSRRPITDPGEIACLERLGRELARLRRAAALSIRDLAWCCEMHPRSISRLESGSRRTRRSTLERICDVYVSEDESLGPLDVLVDRLCALAGPGLAPESPWQARIERRRRRRSRRREAAMSAAFERKERAAERAGRWAVAQDPEPARYAWWHPRAGEIMRDEDW
jgi:transcriptional regulator with XRE-family HTH domain